MTKKKNKKKITATKRSEKTLVSIKEKNDCNLASAIENLDGFRLSEKFKNWVALFMDKNNPEYQGNATKCALKAYDTNNYFSAARIGYENSKKLKIIVGTLLEFEGMGFGEMVKIGAAKMLKGSFQDWKDLMIMAGYFEPSGKRKRLK